MATKSKTIKLLLVDDQNLVLAGLRAMLEQQDDFQVIGTASNGKEALELLEQGHLPDVVTLDMKMPEMSGIVTAKAIRAKYPGTRILVVSADAIRQNILEAMQIGVHGYILKSSTKEALFEGIRAVYDGKPYYQLKVMQVVTAEDHSPRLDIDALSSREIEVLKEIANGLTSKEVGYKLHISIHTVNTHRRNLLHKLGVPNDKQLIIRAIKEGLIEL